MKDLDEASSATATLNSSAEDHRIYSAWPCWWPLFFPSPSLGMMSVSSSDFPGPSSTESPPVLMAPAPVNVSAAAQSAVGYKTAATQTEATMLELFQAYSKRKWALSLAEQYMNIHPSFREGDIILKSSDDLGFKVSLASLEENSAFFKDLADLPRPEDTSNVIPIPNASAKTLEILLSALRPGGKDVPVPSVSILNELVDVVEAFDFNMRPYHNAVFSSGLNIVIKYAFAYAYAHAWKDGLEREIWKTDALNSNQSWNRCPEALVELCSLRQRWSLAPGKFKNMFVSTEILGKDDFVKKCERRGRGGCPAYIRSGGDWDTLKRATANAVSRDFPKSPYVKSSAVELICNTAVPCTTWERLSRHAADVWDKLVYSGKWKN